MLEQWGLGPRTRFRSSPEGSGVWVRAGSTKVQDTGVLFLALGRLRKLGAVEGAVKSQDPWLLSQLQEGMWAKITGASVF